MTFFRGFGILSQNLTQTFFKGFKAFKAFLQNPECSNESSRNFTECCSRNLPINVVVDTIGSFSFFYRIPLEYSRISPRKLPEIPSKISTWVFHLKVSPEQECHTQEYMYTDFSILYRFSSICIAFYVKNGFFISFFSIRCTCFYKDFVRNKDLVFLLQKLFKGIFIFFVEVHLQILLRGLFQKFFSRSQRFFFRIFPSFINFT